MLHDIAKLDDDTLVKTNAVDAVRDFNRFYTKIIGLLDDAFLGTQFSLPQARVVYELSRSGPQRASFLANDLSMDLGQLSRLVQNLRAQGIVTSSPDPSDARAQILSLSDIGQDRAHGLNEESKTAISEMLKALSPFEQTSIIQNMAFLRAHFANTPRDERKRENVDYRGLQVGDIGWLTSRQAQLYQAEYNWDIDFEILIAGIYRDYATLQAPGKKEFWVAEVAGVTAGSLFIVPSEHANTAQLRLLYVEPFARGRGIAQQLVQKAVQFSAQAGYDTVTLWTQDCLTAARTVYTKAGFILVREERHTSFGQNLNGQYWSLALT